MNEKVALVLLNYNDEETTLEALSRTIVFSDIQDIVLVDNHSKEYSLLEEKVSKHVHFIRTEKNLGYAGGNNAGLEYAVRKLHADYVIIANPDVEFDDAFVQLALKVFHKYADAGVVTCRMNSQRLYSPACRLPRSAFEVALSDLPVIGSKTLAYKKNYFEHDVCEVEQVWGSLLMLSRAAIEATKGFDPRTFLFYEETILGYRLKKAGFKSYLITNHEFLHHESVSINKAIPDQRKKFVFLYDSQILFCKEYLKSGFIDLAFVKLIQNVQITFFSCFWGIKRMFEE